MVSESGGGRPTTASSPPARNGGFKQAYEEGGNYGPVSSVKNACTTVCGAHDRSKICSKTMLVDISHESRPGSMRALCIIDEQSNATFCDPRVAKYFDVETAHEDYDLDTMNGTFSYKGEAIEGLRVKGAFATEHYNLPVVLTHPEIVNSRNEVTTY